MTTPAREELIALCNLLETWSVQTVAAYPMAAMAHLAALRAALLPLLEPVADAGLTEHEKLVLETARNIVAANGTPSSENSKVLIGIVDRHLKSRAGQQRTPGTYECCLSCGFDIRSERAKINCNSHDNCPIRAAKGAAS